MKIKNQHNGAVRVYSPVVFVLISVLASLLLSAFGLSHSDERPVRSQINPAIQKVRQIYTTQVGIREKQPNSGPAVEKYLNYVNLPKGNPWCAAFVCWVYGKAGIVNPRSGWSPDLFREGRIVWERGESRTKYQESRLEAAQPYSFFPSAINWITPSGYCAYRPLAGVGGGLGIRNKAIPSTGDVFGLFFPEKGRIAHVGFIDKWDGTWLITVEGNTNIAGSREGDGVYRKRRLVTSIHKVARYIHR